MAYTQSSSVLPGALPQPSQISEGDVAPSDSLLRLPTEILINVVRQYVDDVGVEEAWYMRTVCRKFATSDPCYHY
jgi:hypothetical protein